MTTTLVASDWGKSLRPSPTLAMYKQVQELLQQGVKVHDFGIGEMQPEFAVPDVMKQAMKDAIDSNQTYYTGPHGDGELLQALSQDFSKNFGFQYSTKQFVVTSGPKDALYKACQALLSPVAHRNRVVVFTPAFEAFENIPFVITGKYPIRLPTDSNFYPIADHLKRLLAEDDSIAIVIINSPNNPSGAVYPAALLEELANVIRQYPQVACVFDEVYRTIWYDDNKVTNIAAYIPQQTLIVGGASKEVAGTGTRLGYVAGPEEIIAVIAKIQGNLSACVSLPCQRGFAKLLKVDVDMEIRFGIRLQLQARRDHLLASLKKHANLSCISLHSPQGAFYAFPNVTGLYGKTRPDGVVIGESDEDVVKFLIEIARVATIPGVLFGTKGHIRIAYASKSLLEIEQGVQAISDAVAKLT